ncbi:hypothetical protein [Yersinia rochesterensis]|uniref:Uncharacterized protein n=1 Tax=Yersinia rochesterensis TaxID=1604335 RepID=A0A8D4SPK6_9GAMM|nr:hypothetical protein [Yersinia rochesterensis]AYD42631.1 hypothetical protein DXZ79_02040 [Yersinia rochesterensis]
MLVGNMVVLKSHPKKEMTVIEVNDNSVLCGWHENKGFHKKNFNREELIIKSPPNLISSIF